MSLMNNYISKEMNKVELSHTKHTSLFMLFFYILIICRLLQRSFKIQNFSYVLILLLSAIGIILYELFSEVLKKNIHRLTIIISSSVGIILYFIISKTSFVYFFNTYYIKNFIDIDRLCYVSSPTSFHQFTPILILIVPLFSALFLFLRSRMLATLSMIILILPMLCFWINRYDEDISVYLFIFILIFSFDSCVNSLNKVSFEAAKLYIEASVSKRNILIYSTILAFAASIICLLFVNTLGTKGYYQLKDEKNYAILNNGEASKNRRYNLSYSGYTTNNAALGGPIAVNHNIAFKVKSSQPYYLRGVAKDFYDGHSWSKTLDNFVIQTYDRDINSNKEFSKYMGTYEKEELQISPGSLTTSTLFSPLNTFNVISNRNYIGYDTNNTFMILNKQSVADSYKVDFYSSSTGIENFGSVASTSYDIPYNKDAKTEEEQKYYNNFVKSSYEAYLQVPSTITPETYKLVTDITKDCKNSREKVLRIKQYLSTNYKYDINVSSVPQDRDFIDYFLFTEKKGYCTYFATTATIFCRIAGIPARYVEGFSMNNVKDANGDYLVRNDRAHAWTEILISPEAKLWSIVDCVPQGPDLLSNSTGSSSSYIGTGPKNTTGRASAAKNNLKINSNLSDTIKRIIAKMGYFFIISCIIVSIIILIILFKVFKFFIIKRNIMKNSSIIPLYLYIKHRLKQAGINNPNSISDLEAAQLIEDENLRPYIIRLVNEYYAESYGGIKASQIDKKHYYRFIESHIKEKQSSIRYFINKYLFVYSN